MDFGNQLKSIRNERNITQQRFADLVGVSVVTVRNWEHNIKKPNMETLLSIADVLQVSTDSLLGFSIRDVDTIALTPIERHLVLDFRRLDSYGRRAVQTLCSLERIRTDEQSSHSVSDVVGLYSVKNDSNEARRKSERFIPKYLTPAAAGYSAPLDGEAFEMLLVDDSVPPQADYAVNIQGDSMYPYIKDGDMVYVQKDCQLSVGDVGIFCVDGSMYCKQYYIDENKNLLLVSANPDLRKSNVFVSTESSSSVICYGKVLLGHSVKLPDYIFES